MMDNNPIKHAFVDIVCDKNLFNHFIYFANFMFIFQYLKFFFWKMHGLMFAIESSRLLRQYLYTFDLHVRLLDRNLPWILLSSLEIL